ncbi:MAG: type II toxin-antitoxin system RelE/ParE family toxin [Pseudomonadota bacterium]
MSRLLFTPLAKSDLAEIWDYTVERWSLAQAETYVREIDAACHELAAGARTSTAIDDIRPGYRKAVTGKHVVFFTLSNAGDTVVIRILHQSRDVLRHLP